MFTLQSTAFENGQPIPQKYAKDGRNVSPPLAWSEPPERTRAYALICDDPDAPMDKPFVHWLAANIPGDRDGLDEGETGGAVQGENDFGEVGYGGPMPPEGHGTHHYHFTLYALDEPVEVSQGAPREAMESAIRDHVLDSAELVGTYER
jgi:hypothetical protein